MDLQPSQNNYSEEDRLQTSESLSGFFSRMIVSNKTMERIMRQDSNLSPYDGFRIGGIGKVLNQIGLNQRKHHIIYKVSSGEFAIPMEFTGKLMFDIHPRIAYNLADQDFSRVLTLHQDFKRKDLMKEGKRPYSITYRIAYALSNTHHSDLFIRKEYIEIPEFSRNSLRLQRKRERLVKSFDPQEIRPVVDRYEGMLEIAGHEILVTGVAGRENGSMILGISFLEDHKPWGRKGNGMEFSLDGVTIRLNDKPLFYIHICGKRFFTKNPNTQYGNREAKIMIGEHLERPGLGKRGDVDAKLTHPKMQDKRKFGKVLLSFRQQGLIDSDSFYEESEGEIKNLKEVMQELKTMDISEESQLSLENVKRLIPRNFSENPLAWWDRNKIEATLKIKEECKYEYVRYKPIQMNMEDKKDMQMIIKEHINLGLIEPGISAYSSPGFLVRNHGEIKRDQNGE
ncbi:movement protein [Sesamum angolense]|uniref:Movement protein n=1 Tax=Sesamum angolense TaxID=2727404 RepID=A0AAE1X302_9LAMI|nr:movement protein [Sesamum angolense]